MGEGTIITPSHDDTHSGQTLLVELMERLELVESSLAIMHDGVSVLQRAAMHVGVKKERIDQLSEELEMLHQFVGPLKTIMAFHKDVSFVTLLREFVSIPKAQRPAKATWYLTFRTKPSEKFKKGAHKKDNAKPQDLFLCVDSHGEYITSELPDEPRRPCGMIEVNPGMFSLVLQKQTGVTQMFACGLGSCKNPLEVMRFLRLFNWEGWDPSIRRSADDLEESRDNANHGEEVEGALDDNPN